MSAPAAPRQAIERYLAEVVEALDLCPWSGPARRAGRVHIEVMPDPASALQCAERLAHLGAAQTLDAVLLVFDLAPNDPRHQLGAFETFLRDFQATHRALDAEAFYCVLFHPRLTEAAVPRTAYSLIRTIRRSPLPMIQCLRASVMDQARRRGQQALKAGTPAGFVQADPQLSEDIAQANFARHGSGAGRATLEARLAQCAGPLLGSTDRPGE